LLGRGRYDEGVIPADLKTADYSQATMNCDVLMKGGVTSGIVYPLALCRLAQQYVLRNIGGTSAGAIAAALGAARLFLLTDVAGVLDKDRNLLSDLVPADVERLKADGTISGGMIPKMETCVTAIEGGVDAAVILDGRIRHAMLLEIFTRQGAGTLVRAAPPQG
jgi:acetylglutamate kinase